MHRTLEITVPPTATDTLRENLVALEEVIGLSVQRSASVKPVGDILIVHVLNRGADEVLRRVRAAVPDDHALSIVTSEAASFIAPAEQETIEDDKDEAIWEEMESGLRHQGAITPNYLLLMALGGIICAIGLVSEPVPQAIAFVASAIIAPGFDPMTKVPLGLVLGRWPVVWRGFRSTFAGYAVLIAAAALTMLALVAAGETTGSALAENPEVKHLAHPHLMELLIAAAGALAGVVMLAAFRRSFQAGPLIAMAFIPAATLIGAGLAVGRPELALEGLERFGADWGFIVGLGIPFLWFKQRFVHRRKPLA
ncbi:hypothetical protein SAMN00120144_3660 [Hymenobacter roseosalivarius DSM 11622]|uniref:DUF389 domain-containing protein n=1 Tax=Hymenobacter roseosalivarius DSM 11622 TaxID=645990 RepID=A0A1W1W0G3_9BACT|nr:DUF389 domain-containing protein [Hymenobacter roseosalivarius]SMB99003.1 hypothetical protein SAMN00120144_3660 [Hymenobacter roseosalivarius DSM 11622]